MSLKTEGLVRLFLGKEKVAENHNITLYDAAGLMARLLGSYFDYAPGHIGFIYAPAGLTPSEPSDRLTDWDNIKSSVESMNGNMVLSSLSPDKGYTSSDESKYRLGNVVSFSSLSDKLSAPIFSGGGFSPSGPSYLSDAYYQVVLLNRRGFSGAYSYVPYAYANVNSDASGVAVIENAEFQINWDITLT